MDVARPTFRPDQSLTTAEMETLQRQLAQEAVFTDDHSVDPAAIAIDGPVGQTTLSERGSLDNSSSRPLVAGVDQAFLDDSAVSAVVVMQGRQVVERAYAIEPVQIPYVPGLLSFREGGAILSALAELDCEPALLFVDGSGRIHYREAGLATHIGVTVDVPTVGVAKNLLCGRPQKSLDRKLSAGERVAIEANDQVETATDGTVVGYAVQTRQYESKNRHINPLLVSPGHRVAAETAAEFVLATAGGYKLPEPTRLADSYADELKATL